MGWSFLLGMIFMGILVFFVEVACAQTIVANGTRAIDTEKQVVFYTLTESAVDYRCAANTPILSGAALQTYLDSKVLRFWYSILHTSYPGAEFSSFPGDNKLEQLQAWITAGAENPDGTVIKKVPWIETWNLEKVQAAEEMKASVFYGKTPAQINAYIDSNWTSIATSKATFKKLVKDYMDLLKRLEVE